MSIPQEPLTAHEGYVTHTGHVMTKAEAEAYNKYTEELNRERYPATREFLKDQRHRYFVAICNEEPRMSTVNPQPKQEHIP